VKVVNDKGLADVPNLPPSLPVEPDEDLPLQGPVVPNMTAAGRSCAARSRRGFHRSFFFQYVRAMDPDQILAGIKAAVVTGLPPRALPPRLAEDDDKTNTPDGPPGPNTGVVVKARPRTRKPAMYKVLMLNDDYTPMEFVVHVLERFFQKNRDEATRIMLHVHKRGVGVCGVYTYEVAETKVTQVMDLARQNQHPLQCTIEKD